MTPRDPSTAQAQLTALVAELCELVPELVPEPGADCSSAKPGADLSARLDTIVFANPCAAVLLGSSVTALFGAAAMPLFGLAEGESVTAWLRERDDEVCEELVHGRDGHSFPARVGVTTLDRERTRFALSMQDITEARMIGARELLGCRCMISGVSPALARAFVDQNIGSNA